MGGGLMQLVAYGAQDIYLTGQPQITFFKVLYRRHTNFSIESIEQTFNGTADFGKKVSCTVSRNGDLIHRVYLQVSLPALSQTTGTVAWTRNIGNVLIDEVSISIGGQIIDKHYGQWLHIWNELTQTAEHADTYSLMTGNSSALTTQATSVAADTLYVPLQFWFNRNAGLALPLIALQYHEVKIDVTFRAASQCYVTDDNAAPTSGTPALSAASLYVDYIYLDTDERRQFAQVQHEYLIEQLQYGNAEAFSNSALNKRLAFNHPTKFVAFVCQLDSNVDNGANRWTDFTTSGATLANAYKGGEPLSTFKLQLNGHDRFSTRSAGYFNLVQPYQHFTNGPATGIYVYSFALNPEQHQPSGSVNMSRIDNATMSLTLTTGVAAGKFYVYAFNYNVLRVMAGMGGLAYSN